MTSARQSFLRLFYADLRYQRMNAPSAKAEVTFMTRFVEIDTPLEPDELLFHRDAAKEELSRLSEYELDLLSSDGAVKLDDVLGKSVTVKLELTDENVRTLQRLRRRASRRSGCTGAITRIARPVGPGCGS